MTILKWLLLLVLVVTIRYGVTAIGTLPPLPTTGVRLYLGEEDRVIPNYFMVKAAQFHDIDTNSDSQNDGIWCQSALNESMIGVWYLPNGSPVPTQSGATPLQSYNTNVTGQVGLLRRDGLTSFEGLYSCIIPNEKGVNQTLYVAAYRDGTFQNSGGPSVDRNLEFTLLSTRDANPPVFTLYFNVTNTPPTTVTCSVNSNTINIPEEDLNRVPDISTDSVRVGVTITIRRREAGEYTCTVRTDSSIRSFPTPTTPGINISVTNPPTNFSSRRAGVTLVLLTWSPPIDNIPTVKGYEVLLDLSNGTRVSIETNATELNITFLQPDVNHTVFVVAYGGDLPSESIDIAIPQVISAEVTGPNVPLSYGSNFIVICNTSISAELDEIVEVQVMWADPYLQVINITTEDISVGRVDTIMLTDTNIYSLDLNFINLQASQVGNYTCGSAFIEGQNSDLFTLPRQISVSVQVPDPVVSTLVTPNTELNNRNFESGMVSLGCHVIITSLDVDTNVSITWFGPNGVVVHDNTRYSIDTGQLNNTVYGSSLNISDLSLTGDNGAQYYCRAQVGANASFVFSSFVIPSEARSENVTVIVEAVPLPSVEIFDMGIPIVTETFTLTCNVTVPDNLVELAKVNVIWLYNGNRALEDNVTLTNNGDNSATLTFFPVNQTQEGLYTCTATLSLPGIPLQRSTSKNYTFSTLGNPTVSITTSESNIAGNMYSLLCSVSVVFGTPNITWFDNNGMEVIDGSGITQNLTMISDTEQTYELQFNPLMYTHGGEYACVANLTVTRGDDIFIGVSNATATVYIIIPTPTVSITPGSLLIFTRATQQYLSCIVSLSDPIPPTPNVTINLDKNGQPVDLSNSRINKTLTINNNVYSTILAFTPIDNDDAGNYTCTGTVSPIGSRSVGSGSIGSGFNFELKPFIISSNSSALTELIVQAIPAPVINVTTIGAGVIGENYSVVCTVDVDDNLYNIVVDTTIVKIGEGVINSSKNSGDNSISISYTPLNTSHRGQYQCVVNISQIDISYQVSYIETFTINTIIPQPTVTVSIHPVDPNSLIEATYLDIVCNVSISDVVNTGVNVDVEWSRNGGSPLTNNSDYTISSLTMLGSHVYTSTLHIESLSNTRDNVMYFCTASVLPSPVSSYITGNENNNNITLNVADFTADHVIVDILFPTTPTAGDQFTMTCNINIPERLVHDFTRVVVVWSYDLARQQRVEVINSDATIGNLTKIGNLILSTLTLNPVKTSDGRRYYCSVTFSDLGVNDHVLRDLNVQIPPPSMVITRSPSTGPIYESTNFNLTCTGTLPSVVDTTVSATVVWFDPQNNTIPVESRRMITNVSSNGNNEFESTLVFLPIDNGDHNSNFNDTGTYTCQMTISSIQPPLDPPPGYFIINGVNSITDTITVQNMTDMQLNIYAVGSTEVGQNLNITCTVRVVERLVVTPHIVIMKMNTTDTYLLQDINIPYTITTDDTGSETNWTIILEPVRFEDRGVYICKADFNVTGVNGTNDPATATYDAQFVEEDYELIVDFPPVTPNIFQNRQGILYAGTPFFLRCVITLNDLVTIPVIVRNQWTRNGISVPSGLSNDATIKEGLIQNDSLQYEATLYFNPLDNADDSGKYSCNFNILPNISDYEFVRNSSANTSITITVQAIPSPIMNIMTNGIARPGEEYNITCTVEVIDRLIVTPTIIWIKDSINTSLVSDDLNTISVPSVLSNISDTMYSLSLFFSSLNTSDAGQYTCQANIIVTEINVTVTNTSVQDLPLQIPTPDLDISLSRQSDYLAGSELTITCDITIDDLVNTPFIVNTVWTMLDEVSSGIGMQVTDPEILKDGSGSRQSRISLINPVEIDFNTYRSQVQFSTLSSSMDSGMYTCTVDVMPMVGYNYINAASTTNITTNFTVEDPVIGDFAAMPDSFLGLETSCSDSDPYDNFTLVCTASKPALVIPALEVIWLHNGTERQRVTTQNDDTYVTNTLSFLTSFANDSGTYTCTAKLTIPESPDISSTENSTAILRFQRNPHVAIDISSTVGQTTSTIYFTIPSITYTPEIYHINYIGLELQNTLTTSSSLVGTDNITAVNLMYQIILTDLEEANTYNYTVVSTNCIGNTSSETMNFTTLPSLPIASPRNLTNTTFLPRNVTLDWDPPVRVDQNGEIVGYNLTCIQNNDGSEVSGLTATQNSPVTMFTIPVLLPFTEYTCNLSSINVVGEGPATQHSFKTAQDRPDDAPQDFISIPTKTDITFNWRHPVTPNGIIIQYNLTVINLVTNQINNTIINVTSNQETFSMTINGFSPYQNYTATVSASTSVGYGPSAITKGRTNPDIASEPLLVIRRVVIDGMFINNTIPVVNDTAVNLTWSPPTTPNGFINRYMIYVTGGITLNQVVTAVPNVTTYTHIIGKLSPGVPYYITVVAVNELGEGNAVSITVFTKYLTPLIVPGNIETTRSSDGSSITISWNPVTLEQARGFFQYQIILQPQNNRRRQTSDITRYVPYNQTSITVSVDAQLDYSVTVGVAVQNETGGFISGPTSPPVTVNSPITTQPPDNTTLIGIIVGVVLGVIIAIIIIIVIIVCCVLYKRRYKGGITFGGSRNKPRDLFELVESPIVSAGVTNNFSILNDAPDIMNGSADTKPLSPDKKKMKEIEDEFKENQEDEGHLDEDMVLERMKPIAVASFHEHVQRMHIDSDKGFESEYKSVPMQTDTPFNESTTEANKPKNRFANIFPYDFSRVKLQNPQGTPDGDYINACFIDGYMRKECYIAAQGPLPTTVGDFWRMIWEQRVNHIVMLTGVIEGGKKKCEQYWPDKVGETLDVQNGFVVLLNSFVPFADYIIRDFKVTKSDDPEARPLIVSHYHFTSWPDHGVPQFATSLIGFIKRVQKDHDKDKGVPLLVHCSAGVGRTGTFIMLDSMIDRLKLEDSINIYEFLRQMRSKRMFMVQTLAQYVFIHDAMDELTTCGETGILASNLRARVNKMHKIVPGKNVTGFQEQFELLEQVGYKPSENACSDGTETVNASKNRYPDILPLNMHRPRLRPDGSAGSDYINASYIDGYKQRNAYIVTQGPLKNTVEEFWRMIMEFKNRCIVQLCNNVEEGMEKCYMYWPTKEGEPVEYGRMKVTLQSETPSGDYIIRKLLVCNERGGKSEREGQVITQFHYTTWPEHGHPTSTGSIIELIDMLTRAQMNSGNKAIAIVCNDGVGRSGAFICIHSQLERLKTEGEVDIFKYLKTARTRRIGLLSELDHYVFCHEVLADYVEAFDPYANFKDMS